MENRVIVSIYCTFFSLVGVVATFSFGSYLWFAAWVAYFSILYFWVKNNRAPVPLVVVGTVLGTVSLGSIFFAALVFTFPGVCLMTYIFFQSILSESSHTQSNRT